MNAKELHELLKKSGLPQSKVYDAHNKYYSGSGYPNRETRKKYTDYCSHLIDGMVENGGKEEEFERALLFSFVCIDSIKYKLSILKAKEDLGIDELYLKYYVKSNSQ